MAVSQGTYGYVLIRFYLMLAIINYFVDTKCPESKVDIKGTPSEEVDIGKKVLPDQKAESQGV